MMTRDLWRSIVIVVALKIVLGLLLIWGVPQMGLSADYVVSGGGDDESYIHVATKILSGDFFSDTGFLGYSFLIAFIMIVTGHTSFPGISLPLISANIFIFSTGVAILSMIIVKKFWLKEQYALYAGLAVTLMPYVWYLAMKDFVLVTPSGVVDPVGFTRAQQLFGLVPLSDWFGAFLVAGAMILFLSESYGWSGFLYGLSFFVRAQNVLFLVFFSVLLLFLRKWREFWRFGLAGACGGSVEFLHNLYLTGSPFIFASYSVKYNPIMVEDGASLINFIKLPMLVVTRLPIAIPFILIFIYMVYLSLKYFYGHREKFYFLLISGVIIPLMLFATGPTIRNPRYFLPFIPAFLVISLGAYESLLLGNKNYNPS